MYDRSKLDEIKLEDICNLYGVEVKRNGKNLIGRLRNEKTPSFCIYENNNIWVDFGTNEKGGSIKLVQKIDIFFINLLTTRIKYYIIIV